MESAQGSINPAIRAHLAEILGADAIVSRPTELKVYECDGWTMAKSIPDLLLRPRTTAEVSAVLQLLYRNRIPFVPRGAGTGLSGGSCRSTRPS